MNKSNLIKYCSLFFIILAAQILLSMIEGQIEERSSNRYYARSSIESSWTGSQTILATVLTVPYQEAQKSRAYDKVSNSYIERTNWINKDIFILPKDLNISSKLKHQVLTRGIYDVPVYTAELNITGLFEQQKLLNMINNPKIKLSKKAYLSIGVTDTRGINGSPSILIEQKMIDVMPGSNLDFSLSGFHGEFLLNNDQGDFSFEIKMQVKGMGDINFITTGKENKVDIESDWPHPSFKGAFLPISRKISASGYNAEWKTGIFSTDIENTIQRCFDNQCDNIYSSSFGVNHIEAVDVYLKSLRSIKYGLLVVIITFTIFILYEVLNKEIRIHPVSYGLTGMALAIFFLLLIALSEHISFLLSYWISSFACSALIGYYVRHLSQSKQHGGMIFALLNGFYLVLFFIIRSEDHALLSGSILLFVLLAVVMVITKRVDWYQIGGKS